MPLWRGTDGRVYRPQDELARGGEGTIVTLQGHGDLVAKLYLPGQATPARENKLRAMLADPPRDEMRERFGHAAIAWPQNVLTETGRFVGFVMPRIDKARPLLNAYNPRARDALGFDWRSQHQVAANLCAAVNALHVKGYVVGDLNPRNILVTAQGLVTLVDTDSFQVRAHGLVHRCLVGTPEYTPRELQGHPFDRIDRTPEHDRFGLAVLVFQLLMEGFHPFSGSLKDPGDSLPGKIDEWCIQNGVFPWTEHPRLRRPPAARPLEDLAADLRDLFRRCFLSGHTAPALRPEALAWHGALLAAREALVRCPAGNHWLHPGGGPCHACRRAVQPGQTVQRRPRPTQAPAHPPPYPSPPLQPSPHPQSKRPPQPPPGPVPPASHRWSAIAFVISIILIQIYNWWPQTPEERAKSYLDRAEMLQSDGNPAAAFQPVLEIESSMPPLTEEFAREQASLYRELARRAENGADADRAKLARKIETLWTKRAEAKAKEAKAKAARERISAEMATLPGGEFLMGCGPKDSSCEDDEKPPHRVQIRPFRIGGAEVTQGQWRALMGANPSEFAPCGEECPVENVSWNDIQAFLARLNANGSGKPYRLPTEAEWEYACRAGRDTPYCGGYDPDAVAWHGENSDKAVHRVQGKRANDFGLYDMSGNVWEWVADCWHDGYQDAPVDGSAWRENCLEGRRVNRGGSWYHGPGNLRSADRVGNSPDYRNIDLGFRLAQDP